MAVYVSSNNATWDHFADWIYIAVFIKICRHQLMSNSSGVWPLVKPPFSKCSECMLITPKCAERVSDYWLRSKCWVCCQHIYLWSWMRAFWYPFHRWAVQVLCVVTAQGGGRCWTIHTVKIAVHSAESCCTASTMALTSSKQKFMGHVKNTSVFRAMLELPSLPA